jgi:hypothetical protein
MSNDVKNWTPNQLRLIEWLATPGDVRTPHTQGELAKEIGVKQETLSRWKSEPGLMETVGETARELLKKDLPEIYGALIREAKDGNFQHIKLALELSEHYVEKKQLTGPNNGPIQVIQVGSTDGDGNTDEGAVSWP